MLDGVKIKTNELIQKFLQDTQHNPITSSIDSGDLIAACCLYGLISARVSKWGSPIMMVQNSDESFSAINKQVVIDTVGPAPGS